MTDQLGWLDTNIFFHSLYRNDRESPRCRDLLSDLVEGRAEAWIDPIVVHELSYILTRHPNFPTRAAIHEYIRGILVVDAIHAHEKEDLLEAIARWEQFSVGFADAWLTVHARRTGLPVCSANRRHFTDVENTF